MHPHELNPDLVPWAQESEMAVLGAVLQDNTAWDSVADLLEPRHFYDSGNALIFTTIAAMVLATKPADVLTVYAELQRLGKSDDEYGGLPYLNQLTQYRISTKNARQYAQVVAEKALLRGLLEASEKVRALAVEPGELSVAQRLDQAQQVLQAVQVTGGRRAPTPIEESVLPMLDRIQNRADGTEPRGIPTGIPELDRLLGGGFKGGKQVIIAARPSVGKSSLAQQFCLSLAVAGHASAFFSQEMGKDELTDRAAANLGRLDLESIISGRMQDEEWSRLTDAVERLRGLPFFLDDQPALTLHDIAAKARMLKRQHDIKLIAIDYIQLCAGGDKESRHHQIEQLSRGLKNLAKQLDITVLTLSQLNREVEKRTTGRPVLSDLKESGSIEEDADVVMLLSRNGEEQNGFRVINCDVPKNRQGRTGAVTLGFNGQHQAWQATVAPVDFKKPARKHFTEDV